MILTKSPHVAILPDNDKPHNETPHSGKKKGPLCPTHPKVKLKTQGHASINVSS